MKDADAKSTPASVLTRMALEWNVPIESEQFAKQMDEHDQFAKFREMFVIPKKASLPNGKSECLRFRLSII